MDDHNDFDEIKISVASPEQISEWSYGEITKPETINYRTLKPEKDGLFDERIFGPSKDFECFCGKYKKVRYKGIVCDKCGVEVTRSSTRRERMGHIQLAVPVTHIWFLRGTPSILGLILGIPVRKLEQVVYFASYIITEVDEEARRKALEQVEVEFKSHLKKAKSLTIAKINELKKEYGQDNNKFEKLSKQANAELAKRVENLKFAQNIAVRELGDIKVRKIISELDYRDLSLKYGLVFKAGIGAEALLEVIQKADRKELIKEIKASVKASAGQKRNRLMKRLRAIRGLNKAGIDPSWLIMQTLPVIPPDLRPMVQLDGGRFATSDLNDLYRRVINRNNRLKKLLDLGAPEVITRNEKRMLQESIDALFNASARETSTASTGKRQLKSFADILKGKQGRFRQNLLGKRVDYSGRSVIVVGPTLRLDECGVPKNIALELFRPFIISELMKREITHNVKSAGKMIERREPEVWDALEEVIKDKHVLLNRAPTLHRLSIQAFKPILIEGNAIQLHPSVCTAFNADFDGDQMAIHLPLSVMAQKEAAEIMLSKRNLVYPSTGESIVTPSQDMVLGCYYITQANPSTFGSGKVFADADEAVLAYQTDQIGLQALIKVRLAGQIIETTVGRLLFNRILPKGFDFINEAVGKKKLGKLLEHSFEAVDNEESADFIDRLKDIGFQTATQSGATFAIEDIKTPAVKDEKVAAADKETEEANALYQQGLISEDERYQKVLQIWDKSVRSMEDLFRKDKDPFNPIHIMVDSGARGNIGQINQIAGIRGQVVNPTGKIIELPIKTNFKEGHTNLEYFISTHGARKGGADTALRTSDAGYLTRRLVDVAHDLVTVIKDCKTKDGITLRADEIDDIVGTTLFDKALGRYLVKPLKNRAKKTLLKSGEMIMGEHKEIFEKEDIAEISVRSTVACKSELGVCQKCYGTDITTGQLVKQGEAVGIVAAQSIGEPGTQLTMRTFHSGGTAASADITAGLPRVEELFEARRPKPTVEGLLADFDGRVKIIKENDDLGVLQLTAKDDLSVVSKIPKGHKVIVKDKAKIKAGDKLTEGKGARALKAEYGGVVEMDKANDRLKIKYAQKQIVEYKLTRHIMRELVVKDGEVVKKGQLLSHGPLNLQALYHLTDMETTHKYILSEVQKIYALQGRNINDRHVELIIRKMFSRVRIKSEGDVDDFIPGDIVSHVEFEAASQEALSKGKKPPRAEKLLLGVTKAAFHSDSFLSSASFQETVRVLVQSAVVGRRDKLRGLKENVIIGRLIPAGTGFSKNKKLD